MTVWFVSRHPGAIAWAQKKNLSVDHWVTHLDVSKIKKGDWVIGVLPVAMAAAVCAKSARFFTLKMNLREEQRGRELTADEMSKLNCSLQEYFVQPT